MWWSNRNLILQWGSSFCINSENFLYNKCTIICTISNTSNLECCINIKTFCASFKCNCDSCSLKLPTNNDPLIWWKRPRSHNKYFFPLTDLSCFSQYYCRYLISWKSFDFCFSHLHININFFIKCSYNKYSHVFLKSWLVHSFFCFRWGIKVPGDSGFKPIWIAANYRRSSENQIFSNHSDVSYIFRAIFVMWSFEISTEPRRVYV